jgi:hypothetical protein
MSTLTEGQHAGEFLLVEAEGDRSRESVTVLSGQTLEAGEVVGKVARGIGRASVPTVVGTGNGTMSLVTVGKHAKVGSYVVTCTSAVTNGGVFSVVDPDGNALASLTLTVGAGGTTAYVSDHINFSITDGSTDFAADDVFTIVVGTTAPTVIGTGNGTISAISMGKETKYGNYKVECITATTNGGTFQIFDPDGAIIDSDFVLSAGAGNTTDFTSQQINFTITDGSTDFAAGDYFNVAVYHEAGKAVEWDPEPTSYDGREDPAGVLFDAVDASAADVAGVLIARDATVTAAELQWATARTASEKEVAKARMRDELGIVSR